MLLCLNANSFLPTALVLSLSFILLEIYTAVRLWVLLIPRLRGQGKIPLSDINYPRVVALLSMSLLVMVPSAIRTTLLAEVLTFSAGAIILLGERLLSVVNALLKLISD